jgi:hypothetical protein
LSATDTDISYISLKLTSLGITTAPSNPAIIISIGNGAHALYDKSNLNLGSWSVQANGATAAVDTTHCESLWHNADSQRIKNPGGFIAADTEQCDESAGFRWIHMYRLAVCLCSPGTYITNDEAMVFGK